MKNLIICSETTSAGVVVSYEGWWHQPPSFCTDGNRKSGSKFPPSRACFLFQDRLFKHQIGRPSEML